jgi:ADP-ribose pyrophosphatase
MESLLKCRKFEVFRKPIRTQDGGERAYEVIAHPGAVVMLPVLDERNRIILIRNYRHSVEKELWELPAGTLDVPGEDPRDAAMRELEEETGYQAGSMRPLGQFFTSPGILTELIRAYVAADLKKTQQRLEATEQIAVEVVNFTDAVAMIRDGRIEDAKTIATLLMWDLERRNQHGETESRRGRGES